MNNALTAFKDLCGGLARLSTFRRPKREDSLSIGSIVAENASKHPDRVMIVTGQGELSWSAFNQKANQYAHLFLDKGLQSGDRVSILMENAPEMLAALVGFLKIGVVPGLVNINLKGEPLKHCITITESKLVLVGAETLDAVRDIQAELSDLVFCTIGDLDHNQADQEASWAEPLYRVIGEQNTANPIETDQVDISSPAYYIFTSGTTGLPKAAVITHYYWCLATQSFSHLLLGLKPTDRTFVCLPLYHTAAMLIGFGASCRAGSSFYLARKFSASRFWDEVKQSESNVFLYIGELCRYLLNQPKSEKERDNPLTMCVGNGLRPELWTEFKERFGINRVGEYYASTEGNMPFMNIFNRNHTFGFGLGTFSVVRYDEDRDEIVRDSNGIAIPCQPGESGLLLNKITAKTPFNGYTDKKATESKICQNVVEKGDRYFNTGDLIKQVDAGFSLGFKHYQFVDRVGDTFRWKGENVSTGEVSEVLNTIPGVESACVYGVQIPATDGRAGMAAIVVDEEKFCRKAFASQVKEKLPGYAQPIFLRLLTSMDMTGTFKIKKNGLQKEAFDIHTASDPIYVKRPNSDGYEMLEESLYNDIREGNSGF